MRKTILVGAIAAAGLAGPAFAGEGMSYTYGEANYVNTKLNDDGTFGADIDGNGWGLQGAMAVTKMFHVYAEYQNQDFDFDVKIKNWEAGLGLNWSLAPKVDLIGRAAYAKFDADASDLGSLSDNGFALQAGARALVGTGFEVEALAHYVDLGDNVDGTTFRLTGRYNITDMFAFTAGAELDSDTTIWMAGFRINFPR